MKRTATPGTGKLILQTAEEILQEKGLPNTSMDEIAARVGIAKGTLYLHFVKKEDLVLALLERELHTSFETLQDMTAFDDSDISAAQLSDNDNRRHLCKIAMLFTVHRSPMR